MKTIPTTVVLIAVWLTSATYLAAQSDCNPNKIIRTDPANPENTEKSSKKNGPNNGDPNQPQNGNIFNWLIGTEHNPAAFRLNSSVMINDQQLNSPFWEYNNSRTQIFINQWATYSRIDNLPEDGWELIHQDFGYFDNGNARGVPPNGGQKVDYPHIILYNRYTGVLRAFVNIGGLSGNTATIRLEFERGTTAEPLIQTSLLDMTYATEDKPLNALDDFRGANPPSQQARLSGWSPYLGNGAHWYYADFLMLYDVCTCHKRSKLHIVVEIIKKAKISLKGSINGEIIDKNEQTDNKTLNTLPNDGASSYSIGEIWNTGQQVAEKAAQSYNDISAFTSATLSRLQSYHSYGPNLSYAMKEEMDKNKEIAKASLTTIDKLLGYANDPVGVTDLLKATPYIGAAFSVIDFFTAGGKGPAAPQKVSISPMAVNLTVNLQGEIVSSEEQKHLVVWNPGSDIPNLNNVTYEYPYYNQTMGVMNLWKTPVMEQEKFFTTTNEIHPGQFPGGYRYYLKIPDDIQYVINKSAGFNTTPEDLDISVSLIVVFEANLYHNGPFADKVKFQDEGLFSWLNENTASTPLIPIGCLKRINPRFFLEVNNPCCPITPKYYLKVVANLERLNRNQSTQNVIWVGTYRFNIDEKTIMNSTGNDSYYTVSNPMGTFPKDRELSPATEPNPIASNRFAWRNIIIKSGTTFSPSQPITIKAGYNIEVEPGVELPPNVELVIGLPFECTTVLGPHTVTANDCQSSQTYNNNRTFTRSAEDTTVVLLPTESWVNAMPNPSNGQTVMQYSLAQSGFAQLTVTDAFGRQIATLVDNADHPKGTYQVQFGSPELPSGVYYYTLRTGTFVQTKKLVLIK